MAKDKNKNGTRAKPATRGKGSRGRDQLGDDNRLPVGIIDIGSNSVRLVVFDGKRRSPYTFFNEKISCGLGREIASTGRLADDAVERAINALTRFRAICNRIGVAELHVLATAAAREASNGPDFIKWAGGICGQPIVVLSGRQEAEMAANGVMAGIHDPDGFAGDLGGGSLELIDIARGELIGGHTLPLGSLRLMDITRGDLWKARDFIDQQIDSVDWIGRGKGRTFYAVGGTWRAMTRLYMEQYDYPLHVVHNFSVDADEAHRFADYLIYRCLKSPETLRGYDDFSKVRQSTLPYGALLMERLIRKMEPSTVVTSAFGVREGWLYSLLDEAERQKDPLIAACEDLAEMRARCPEHSRELCSWTDRLFEAGDLEESGDERRLRHAACLLSDIGWRAHPDYRGTQTLNIIAHTSFAGVDHPGRAFLALTQFYRHATGREEPASALTQLVDKRALMRARIVGSAVRVANLISAALPGLMQRSPIYLDGKGKLVLTMPSEYSVLEGELLQKRLELLAKLLGCQPELLIAH